MKVLHRLPPTCPAQALDTSYLDDFPDDATYEFRARPAEITKDGTPVLFQQSQEVKSLAQQFCSHWDKNDYAKCGAVLKNIKTAIQNSTTAGPNPGIQKITTFNRICDELEIPSWKYANYYMDLYEYERRQASMARLLARRRSPHPVRASDEPTQFCVACGNRLPDEETFRKIAIRCYKEGFYILGLDGICFDYGDKEFCVCKNRIMSKSSFIHRRRSNVKRMVAFLLARHLRKDHLAQYGGKDRLRSGSSLLKRGDEPPKDRSERKAIQRQWRSEDLILWDVELAAFWCVETVVVYDSDGKPHHTEKVWKPHHIEKVLDTPLVRDLINAKCIKRETWLLRERILRVVSQLIGDENLVYHLTHPVEEPLNPLDGELSPDLKRLWRDRQDH